MTLTVGWVAGTVNIGTLYSVVLIDGPALAWNSEATSALNAPTIDSESGSSGAVAGTWAFQKLVGE